MQNLKLTISMPSYLRPQRTIRAIECIAKQEMNGWQALIGGDGCPELENFILSGYFDDMVQDCGKRGNILSICNYEKNMGGCGFAVTNANIRQARGEYFIFFANDDVILPNHFSNYYGGISGTDLDFAYFNSRIEHTGEIRNSALEFGRIGHSELIIKTSFLKQMPPHDSAYGHDWRLIQNMLKAGAKHKKIDSAPTYIVKSLPNHVEPNIN